MIRRPGRVLLALAFGAAAFTLVAHANRPGRPVTKEPAVDDDRDEKGLEFRLSEGSPDAGRGAPTPAASTEPLDPARTRQLLDALPPLPEDPSDEKEFAFRDKSLPPPRTGRTVPETFPPATGVDRGETPDAGALEVLRRQPEGEVPLAPHVSITFSQPMVAVTSHDELSAEGVPVRLTPQPPGQWRWVGTRTLLFEAARAASGETQDAAERGRFPMATEYTVEIPAGTRSAVGGTLASAVRWTFRTPPAAVVAYEPVNRSTVREPVLFALFDQRIERETVLRTIQLRAAGRVVPVRLATAEEIEHDVHVKAQVRAAQPGRWIAFRPVSPLPGDAAIDVAIGPGTPSAEGPLRTTKAHTWSFRTYGPLKLVRHQCGWGSGCEPGTPFQLEFTNPLDEKSFRVTQVKATPAIQGMRAFVGGSMLTVHGATRGRTTYTVTVDGSLKDAFGQTLGGPATVTFTTTAAQKRISAAGQGFLVLDPAAAPAWSVFTINHDALKVRVHAVGPQDWAAYQKWMQEQWRDDRRLPMPGRVVVDKTIAVASKPDEMVETRVDLSAALREGLGQVVVEVEPAKREPRRGREAVRAWIQATRIGLTAFADAEKVTAYASSLADGRPLGDVEVQVGDKRARTGADGLATVELGNPVEMLVARRGNDLAVLPQYVGWWAGGGWQKRPQIPTLRFFMFDDRGLYKPGEEARLKGWIRVVEPGPTGDLAPAAGVVTAVGYVLRDRQGNEVLKGTQDVDAWGGYDLTLKLPAVMNLGPASLQLTAQGSVGGTFVHNLQVQEFRTPEFEVTSSASEGPHYVGGHATVTARAAYYAGGALPNAEVRWEATSKPARFVPPNRDDWSFGSWIPWWMPYDEQGGESHTETLASRTGGDGQHTVRLDFDAVRPPRASHVDVQATVMDVNRQAWTASTQLLVHPSRVYLGMRTPRPFVQSGQALSVEALAVDVDGTVVPGREVTVELARRDGEQVDGAWTEVFKDVETCTHTSGDQALRCEFVPKQGGSWRLRGRVTDADGRPNETELQVWVAGGDMPEDRGVSQDQVTLVPAQKEFRPGTTAEILVISPFAPAEGVLTLRRSGLLRTERFHMDGATHTLRIPIEEAWTPNVSVHVDLVGASPRFGEDGRPSAKLPKRPAYAGGELQLKVPPAERTLKVDVTPSAKAVDPGQGASLDLVVRDAFGRPVPDAQVAVVVADEAVLALTGYKLADPIAVFYAMRDDGVDDRHLREHLVLVGPEELDMVPGGVVGGVVGGVAGGVQEERLMSLGYVGRAAPPPAPAAQAAPMTRAKAAGFADAMVAMDARAPVPTVRVRSDFRPLAHFDPAVRTDAQGRAQVKVALPDSLTRYRVMAIAATRQEPGDKARFGSGESSVTVRLPLMVRPSAPRFLNYGDRFELPVVLQNQTDEAMTVEVAVRARNASPADGDGRRVRVPANDRVEVRFPAAAAKPGTARFQLVAVSGQRSDAAQIQLPVWTPATTEAFATYGQVDSGAVVQPVRAPQNVVKDFGGLEVTTSSTALQALTDAVLYLVAYPYECTEQMSSRILAVAALRDVLAAFEAKGLPKPDEIVASVDRDVKMLERLQNEDGGWAFWRRGDPSWPYVSIHVAHALQRAKAKGFKVPDATLERSKSYLKDIERHIPPYYGPDARRTLVAYALHVRQQMGDRDVAKGRALVKEAGVEALNFEALGFLLEVLSGDPGSTVEVAAIRKRLANNVSETAAAAHFAVSYGDAAHFLLHSDRRADAIVLGALIADQPKSDLIPKLVEGLLAQRRAGHWENTQENAFVLLALDRYFQAYEKQTPDFVARLWLGNGYAGEQSFRGRSTDRHLLQIPMRTLAAAGPTELTLARDGTAGRLYYRIGMQYAPASLQLAPADHGFTVERNYEAVDDPADVRRDEDGTWHLKAGARIRSRVRMVAPSRRYHVALVDPVPAGLEPQNAALATTGTVPTGDPDEVTVMGAPGLGGTRGMGAWWWWSRPWYEHENLRDERVEAFTSLLWEGVWTYTWVGRATTPGRFVVPPPKAEEMYHPETFGRGASAVVVVE